MFTRNKLDLLELRDGVKTVSLDPNAVKTSNKIGYELFRGVYELIKRLPDPYVTVQLPFTEELSVRLLDSVHRAVGKGDEVVDEITDEVTKASDAVLMSRLPSIILEEGGVGYDLYRALEHDQVESRFITPLNGVFLDTLEGHLQGTSILRRAIGGELLGDVRASLAEAQAALTEAGITRQQS